MAEQPTPEQVQEMQEKMKNMSPEELAELQKQQCIFCQIIDGKVQAKKIYEDDKVVAVLDINPANPGHLLLMTKEHYPLMPLIPEEILSHLFMVTKSLSRVLLSAVNAEGANVFIANGSAAGQRAQHFMLHIIPRKTGDKIPMEIPINEFPKNEIEEAKNNIQEKINAIFNLGKVVASPKPAPIPAKIPAPSKKPTKKKPSKKSKKGEEKEDIVNLDDIANLFG